MIRLGACIATAVCCTTFPAAQAQSGADERVRAEMPRRITEAADRFSTGSLRVEMTVTNTDVRLNKTTAESRVVVKRYRDAYVYETTGEFKRNGKRWARVEGANSTYAFQLERSRNTADWLLTEIFPRDSTPAAGTVKSLAEHHKTFGGFPATVSVMDGDLLLAAVFEKPKFSLKQAETDTDGNIRAVFTYDHPVPAQEGGGEIRTDITFAPRFDWLPIRYTQSLKSSAGERRWTMERKIEPIPDGYTIDAVFEENDRLPKSNYHTRRAVTYRAEAPRAVSEDEFRVTAYGVPEPPEFAHRPTPAYVWLLAAGVGVLGVSFLFRHLARRAT